MIALSGTKILVRSKVMWRRNMEVDCDPLANRLVGEENRKEPAPDQNSNFIFFCPGSTTIPISDDRTPYSFITYQVSQCPRNNS
jgi:hypothetical protein